MTTTNTTKGSASDISIIIAEDEKSFVMRFKLILRKVGIPVQRFHHFSNSEEAIQYFFKGEPQIVFLDLNIKGSAKNGLDMLRELRTSAKPDTRIGIISTSDNEQEIQRCQDLGGNFYIVKTGRITDFETRMRVFKERYIDQRKTDFAILGNNLS